jgi:NAD(P)-dependent dehydrogenase (short-subunit alcohol dehydrogenase family)
VFLLDSNSSELDNTLSKAIEWSTRGDAYKGAVIDLRDRSQIKDAMQQVSAFFEGKLDVLVNNAVATPHVWADDKAMDEGTDEEMLQQWDDKIAVGLTAPFLLSRLCVPMLKAATPNPGCIVNIASTRAYQAEDNHEGYSAAKGGLLGLTRSSAISLGHKHNIRVTAIIPGWISVNNENADGDSSGSTWEQGMSKEDHSFHPAGRVGKVEDMAKALDFLVDSSFVTGAEIVVDGGVTKKMLYPP